MVGTQSGKAKKIADKQKEANRASYGESDIPPIGLDDYVPEQPIMMSRKLKRMFSGEGHYQVVVELR